MARHTARGGTRWRSARAAFAAIIGFSARTCSITRCGVSSARALALSTWSRRGWPAWGLVFTGSLPDLLPLWVPAGAAQAKSGFFADPQAGLAARHAERREEQHRGHRRPDQPL